MLKNLFWYLTSNYFAVALNIGRSLGLAKILLPESLGAWSLISTFVGYFRYYNLGFNSLAYYRAGKSKSADIYSGLLIRTNYLLAFLLGLMYTVCFGVTQAQQFALVGSVPVILIFFLLSIVSTQISETYVAINKIQTNFKVISAYNNILAGGGVSLSILGAVFRGFEGLLIGNLIATIIGLIFLYAKTQVTNYRPRIYIKRFRKLFGAGMYSVLPSLLYIVFTSTDVWMINFKFDLRENGYYALLQTLISVLLILPSSIAVFFFSSKTREFLNNKSQVYKLTFVNFFLTGIMVISAYFFMQVFIKYVAPEYTNTLKIFKVIGVSIPFLAIKNIIVDVFIVEKNLTLFFWLLTALILLKFSTLYLGPLSKFYHIISFYNTFLGIAILLLFYIKK